MSVGPISAFFFAFKVELIPVGFVKRDAAGMRYAEKQLPVRNILLTLHVKMACSSCYFDHYQAIVKFYDNNEASLAFLRNHGIGERHAVYKLQP